MNPDKDQQFIFSKDELSLIKNTFAGDDTLLYTVRKVFLQFPMTEVEKGLVRSTITPEVHRVLKKRILPDIGPEYPLGQLPSLLTTLTNDLKVKDDGEMWPQFKAKKLEIEYLQQQFAVLKDLDTPQPIKLAEMAVISTDGLPPIDAPMNFIQMTAYLFLLGYIDPMLLFIKSIAGQKEETPEEQSARLSRDSSK